MPPHITHDLLPHYLAKFLYDKLYNFAAVTQFISDAKTFIYSKYVRDMLSSYSYVYAK